MKKFLAYYFIYRTTKDPMVAAKIYQILYGNNTTTSAPIVVGSTSAVQKLSNKEELESSLKYLKEKSVKTKKDKESINVLEAVLQNM